MSTAAIKRKNRFSAWIDDFKAKSGADKRRAITDLLFNNAMYIIIAAAVIYIAIRVPAFLKLPLNNQYNFTHGCKAAHSPRYRRGDSAYGYRYFGGPLRGAYRVYCGVAFTNDGLCQ